MTFLVKLNYFASLASLSSLTSSFLSSLTSFLSVFSSTLASALSPSFSWASTRALRAFSTCSGLASLSSTIDFAAAIAFS